MHKLIIKINEIYSYSTASITLHLILTLLKKLKYSIIYNFITKSFINYNQLFRMNVLNFTVLIYNDNINSPDGGMARVLTTPIEFMVQSQSQ